MLRYSSLGVISPRSASFSAIELSAISLLTSNIRTCWTHSHHSFPYKNLTQTIQLFKASAFFFSLCFPITFWSLLFRCPNISIFLSMMRSIALTEGPSRSPKISVPHLPQFPISNLGESYEKSLTMILIREIVEPGLIFKTNFKC